MALESFRDIDSPPGSPQRFEKMERRSKVLEFVLYAGLVFIIGSTLFWAFWINRRMNALEALVVSVTNLEIISNTELCPGEKLIYSYTLHTVKSGVVEVDSSIWSKTPPQTSIYSLPVRAILDGPSESEVKESWTVPEIPLIRQMYELSPGDYERRLAFRNLYQVEEPFVVRIPFTIKEGCPPTSTSSPPESIPGPVSIPESVD